MKLTLFACALAAAFSLAPAFHVAGAPRNTTVDVLRPSSCVPGAKLFYSDPENDGFGTFHALADDKRKPDAIVERYDAATQTVYFKRSDGKPGSLKLSDPQVENWSVVHEGAATRQSTPVPIRVPATAWQTSWDGFITLAEQELNRLAPNAAGPWEGKEVTWEGTISDLEIMMAKNLVRVALTMPARTLKVKGEPVRANWLMVFVPIEYENLASAQKGKKIRFKTTIAPIDAKHASVGVVKGKDGKPFLMVLTRGGTILK